MYCPRCAGAPLRDNVCVQCHGEFLTSKEVRDLLAAANIEREEFVKAYERDGELSMRCPACAVRMWVFETKGERIDYCVECDAVWLDEGEGARLLGEYRLQTVPTDNVAREVKALVPRPLDLADHLAPEPLAMIPNNNEQTLTLILAIGAGMGIVALTGSVFLGLMTTVFGLIFAGPVKRKLGVATMEASRLRAQRPVLRMLTEGLGIDYGETKKRVAFDSTDVAELKIVSSSGPGAQHQLWLHIGQSAPHCLIAAKSRADLEQPTLAVENWLRGVMGLEVYRHGGNAS